MAWFRRRTTEAVAKADGRPNLRDYVAQMGRRPSTVEVDDATEAAIVDQGMTEQPFSPGRPLTPFDNAFGVPRATNVKTGANITARPRSDRISFETLKAITSSYDVARIAIQHRIDDVRSLDWRITNIDGENGDRTDEINRAREIVSRPDGVMPFASWVHAFLEDTMRYDAGCLHRRRNRRGDVIGLEVVDGTTITPLLDFYGRRPAVPAPAYVQYANGLPWSWLSTDDLIYLPFRPQADSLYGLPPMEWLLINANTDIRFQWHFLKFFTEGNVPDGFMQAPPDISSPEQVQEWQDAWDAFTLGDQAVKHQIKCVPNGAEFQAARDDKFDPTFPLFLMRKTCAAYGVTPNDLGFTDDVNRSTGETQVEIQFRVGTLPLVRHVEGIITSFLQDDLGLQVQFRFDTGQEKDDRLEEAQAHDIYVKMGAESVDEVREQVLGLPVDPQNMTPRFVFSTRAGAIPLKSIVEISGETNPETGAPDNVEQVETSGAVHVAPTATIPQPEDTATLTGVPRTAGAPGAQPPETEPVAGKDPQEPVATVEKSIADVLRTWRASSRSRVRKGLPPKRFNDVPFAVADPIWEKLEAARTREEVDAAFQVAKARPFARTGEHGRSGDSVVSQYGPLILAALAAITVGAANAAMAIMSEHSAGKASGPEQDILIEHAIDQFRLSVQADPAAMAELSQTLSALYTDAYGAGVTLASTHAGYVTPEGLVDGPGLQRLLAERDIVLRGIADTQMTRIGDALANGLRQGLAAHTVAADITAIINDADRANLIASTEMARAMGLAAIDRYTTLGVEQIEWLAEADACPECAANMAAGPVNIGDTFPSGDTEEPAHPNCRCATLPVITSQSLAAFADPGEGA